ncbi:unnamed protein product [Rodentolepis nana]|uniref:Uncharacterized protein n=1 Tax=Rodentolepis nana TaxID=102285 RepID=A0A3P7VL08_RODNA|nr:unnamed protein product [Rodentolepis nana]
MSDRNVLSTNAPSVSVPVSSAPTQNATNIFIGADRIVQPQTQQEDNEVFRNSHSSETDTNLHSASPAVSPTHHRYPGGRAGPISPPYNHSLHNEIMYKPAPQVQNHERSDESGGSDIDSELMPYVIPHGHSGLLPLDLIW